MIIAFNNRINKNSYDKRKIDDYIRNYYETNRNALLITGDK